MIYVLNPELNPCRLFLAFKKKNQDTSPVLANHHTAAGQRNGQCDLDSNLLNSHSSGTRRIGLT